MIDVLITYAAEQVSPGFMEPFIVAIVVAIWLAFNEMISILENIRDIGVVLPPFLLELVKMLKKKTEDVVDKEIEDAGNNDRESDSDVN